MKALFLLLLVFAALIKAEILKVGVLYSGSGIYAPYGLTVPPITTEWARSRGDVQPIFCDVASNATKATLCTASVINAGATVIVAPETVLTTPVAALAQTYNIPVIAGMGATSDIFFTEGAPITNGNTMRRFSNLYGVMTPSQNYFNTLLPFMVTRGLHSVTIITTSTMPNIDVCRGAEGLAIELNLPVRLVTLDGITINEAINGLSTNPTDILIVCHFLACSDTLEALANQEYTPKAIVMFECANSITTFSPTAAMAAQYIFTPAQWDHRMRGSTFSDALATRRNYANMFPYNVANGTKLHSGSQINKAIPSAQQFWTLLQNITTSPPTSLAAPQLAALYAVDAATKTCNCTSASGILTALPLINFASFFGTVRFDSNGQNDLHEMVIQQISLEHTIEIVSPLTSITMDAVIPIPTFKERVYVYEPFRQMAEKVVLATAISSAAICAIMACIVFIKREHPLIRGTSYPFLMISLGGAALSSLAPLTWRLDNDNNDCHARVAMFTLGFLILLTPWIAKTIRVWLIFEHKTLTHKFIPHSNVGLLALILALPQLFVVFLWYGTAPLQLGYYSVDPIRPAYDYNECVINTEGSVYLYSSIALFAALIIVGIFFAIAINHIEDRFNDARAMMAVIYNITIWFTVILVTQVAQSSRYASFIVRSFGLQFSMLSSILIFYQRIDSYERARSSSGPKSSAKKVFVEVPRIGGQKLGSNEVVMTTVRVGQMGVGNDDSPET